MYFLPSNNQLAKFCIYPNRKEPPMTTDQLKPKSLADLEAELSAKEQPVIQSNQVDDGVDYSKDDDTDIDSILAEVPVAQTPVVYTIPDRVESASEIKANKVANLLSQIGSINLSAVTFRKADTPLETFEQIENVMMRPTHEVIALQSGYRASIKPLNADSKLKVRKISGTFYEQNKKLLNVIYNHIHDSSLGSISFENWLKVTAEDDLPTLIYGMYCATYPKDSDYTITCPHCNAKNETKVSKERLIEVKDPKAYTLVGNIISRKLTPMELIKESCVNHTTRIMLPESKTIMDLNTPTLEGMLTSLLKSHTNKSVEGEIYGYLKYVSKIAIISLPDLERGKVVYTEIEDETQRVNIIANLSDDDQKELNKNINEKLKEYEVVYRLPNINCANCSKPITDIEIAMSEILFKKLAEA